MNRIRQVFGIAGMLVAVASIALESRPLVWVAIGLLGISVLFRLVLVIRRRHAESGSEDA